MQQFKIPRLAGLRVALAATLALVLVNLGPTVAKADKPAPEATPYTASATCSNWSDEICFVNIAPIPAGKRFVVEYVTILAFTDKASDQKVAVSVTFVTGPPTALTPWTVYPVLHFQLSTTVNWYQASEKVLAFAEKELPPSTSGQLYVTRYPVPASGYNTQVRMTATGYLEDK